MPVFCAYCGKSFTRKEHLERHIPQREHPSSAPRTCESPLTPHSNQTPTSNRIGAAPANFRLLAGKSPLRVAGRTVWANSSPTTGISCRDTIRPITKLGIPWSPYQVEQLPLPVERPLPVKTAPTQRRVAIKRSPAPDVPRRTCPVKPVLRGDRPRPLSAQPMQPLRFRMRWPNHRSKGRLLKAPALPSWIPAGAE